MKKKGRALTYLSEEKSRALTYLSEEKNRALSYLSEEKKRALTYLSEEKSSLSYLSEEKNRALTYLSERILPPTDYNHIPCDRSYSLSATDWRDANSQFCRICGTVQPLDGNGIKPVLSLK